MRPIAIIKKFAAVATGVFAAALAAGSTVAAAVATGAAAVDPACKQGQYAEGETAPQQHPNSPTSEVHKPLT